MKLVKPCLVYLSGFLGELVLGIKIYIILSTISKEITQAASNEAERRLFYKSRIIRKLVFIK